MTDFDTWQALTRPHEILQDKERHQAILREVRLATGQARPSLDPEATTFSPANAWWMAALSLIAYMRDKSSATELLEILGFTLLAGKLGGPPPEKPPTVAQWLLVSRDIDGTQHHFLAFRGTQADQEESVAADIDVAFEPWQSGGAVHHGFHAYYKRALDTGLAAALATHRAGAPRPPLWITGHSLGGAMAFVAAADLGAAQVYTFGAPHVGDEPFCKVVTDRAEHVYRLENCCDLVPRAMKVLPSYSKPGQLAYIMNNSALGSRISHNVSDEIQMVAHRSAAREAYADTFRTTNIVWHKFMSTLGRAAEVFDEGKLDLGPFQPVWSQILRIQALIQDWTAAASKITGGAVARSGLADLFGSNGLGDLVSKLGGSAPPAPEILSMVPVRDLRDHCLFLYLKLIAKEHDALEGTKPNP
jgi:hypothetical protein